MGWRTIENNYQDNWVEINGKIISTEEYLELQIKAIESGEAARAMAREQNELIIKLLLWKGVFSKWMKKKSQQKQQ